MHISKYEHKSWAHLVFSIKHGNQVTWHFGWSIALVLLKNHIA